MLRLFSIAVALSVLLLVGCAPSGGTLTNASAKALLESQGLEQPTFYRVTYAGCAFGELGVRFEAYRAGAIVRGSLCQPWFGKEYLVRFDAPVLTK